MNITRKVFLNNECDYAPSAAIFSGKSYKIFNFHCETYALYNKFFCKLNTNKICYIFSSICFSNCVNKFYALKKGDYKKIYILDLYFNEIDSIPLSMPYCFKANYECITYDNVNDKIILSHPSGLLSFTKEGYFIKEEVSKASLNEISSSNVMTNSCSCNIIRSRVLITSVLSCFNKLFITYIKNNSSFISELSSCGNIINTYYIDDNIFISQMFLGSSNLEFLVRKNNKYCYIYESDYSLRPKKMCKCTPKCPKSNDFRSKVVESIALIETAIAEILHSESEKLNRGIEMASDCKELLKMNDSVNELVTNVTLLENALKEKLSVVLENDNISNCNTINVLKK